VGDSSGRIAVLGAGVTGLVAAYRLVSAGAAVDVYERWPGLGGQVATLDVGDGHLLERYYHHLFTSDVHIARLYDELGMGGQIEWLPSSVAMFADGRSHPFTTPLDLLRFRPLSLPARLRMGAAVLALQRLGGGLERYERTTAHDWIRARMGRQAWEKVWGPLLRGKFGDRAEEISMAWLWKKLTVRRQIRGAEARQELLGYPRGSWQPLLEQLRDRIEAGGGRVLIDRPATGLARRNGGFRLGWGEPGSWRRGHDPSRFACAGADGYETVLATLPNDIFIGLLDDGLRDEVGERYLRNLRQTEYHTALCLLLELDRRFSPFYWTNVADPELPFVGLIEHTNLIDPARYGGRRFLYLANYLEPGDPLLELDHDQLLERYEPGLLRVNPDYSPDWVRRRWVFREPAAQPVVTVGYERRIPAIEVGPPGLFLANTTQIYPEDRGTNYSVRLGTDAAEVVAASSSRSPSAAKYSL
jgi:protoporphyrinogen oxidase